MRFPPDFRSSFKMAEFHGLFYDIVLDYCNQEDEEFKRAFYERFYKPELTKHNEEHLSLHTVSVVYKELQEWCKEVLDSFEVNHPTFRRYYVISFISDEEETRLLLEHIHECLYDPEWYEPTAEA